MKVMAFLREAILNSDLQSKHISCKAIKVDVFDYREMVIVNDSLIFLDGSGLHYSIYADALLEDLIDILDSVYLEAN